MQRVFMKVLKILAPVGFEANEHDIITIDAQFNKIGPHYAAKTYRNGGIRSDQIFMFSSYNMKKSFMTLSLNRKDSKFSKEQKIGEIRIDMKWFEKNYVFIDWFKMKSFISQEPFMCQLQFHVSSKTNPQPFNAPLNETTQRIKGWEEPFLNLQPDPSAFDFFNDPHRAVQNENPNEEEEDIHNNEGEIQLNNKVGKIESSTEKIPLIFWTSAPLSSLKQEPSRIIELY